jgi:hypothetical protein
VSRFLSTWWNNEDQFQENIKVQMKSTLNPLPESEETELPADRDLADRSLTQVSETVSGRVFLSADDKARMIRMNYVCAGCGGHFEVSCFLHQPHNLAETPTCYGASIFMICSKECMSRINRGEKIYDIANFLF